MYPRIGQATGPLAECEQARLEATEQLRAELIRRYAQAESEYFADVRSCQATFHEYTSPSDVFNNRIVSSPEYRKCLYQANDRAIQRNVEINDWYSRQSQLIPQRYYACLRRFAFQPGGPTTPAYPYPSLTPSFRPGARTSVSFPSGLSPMVETPAPQPAPSGPTFTPSDTAQSSAPGVSAFRPGMSPQAVFAQAQAIAQRTLGRRVRPGLGLR